MAKGEKEVKLYILNIDEPNELRRIARILDKHNIRYTSILIIVTNKEKARIIGGIISKYNLQKIKLEDIFLYLTPP